MAETWTTCLPWLIQTPSLFSRKLIPSIGPEGLQVSKYNGWIRQVCLISSSKDMLCVIRITLLTHNIILYIPLFEENWRPNYYPHYTSRYGSILITLPGSNYPHLINFQGTKGVWTLEVGQYIEGYLILIMFDVILQGKSYGDQSAGEDEHPTSKQVS